MDPMTTIRIFESRLIRGVQAVLQPLNRLMIAACQFGDPKFPYATLTALGTSCLRPEAGFKVFWAITSSEWINILMKWMAVDHRPFWWVKEYAPSIELNECFLTCETAPGMPSGHVMCTATVWYVIIKEILSMDSISRHPRKDTLSKILWSGYFTGLTVIGVSRIYVAAHFPSQTILGLAAGVLNGYLVDRYVNFKSFTFSDHAIIGSLMLADGYLTQQATTFFLKDPNWSIKLAEKCCSNPSWVNADTTPLYVVWRSSGAMVGIGIAYYLVAPFFRKNVDPRILEIKKLKPKHPWLAIVTGSVAASISVRYLVLTRPDSANLTHFYTTSFVQYSLLPSVTLTSTVAVNYILSFRDLLGEIRKEYDGPIV